MPIEIFIDGQDCSGKTTTAQLFNQTHDNKYIIRENRLTKINPYYDFSMKLKQNKIANKLRTRDGLFYMAALKDLHSANAENSQTEEPIIQVSSVPTRMFAQFKASNFSNRYADYLTDNLMNKFPQPQNAFFLYNDDKTEMLERLEGRIVASPKSISKRDLVIRDNFDKYLRSQDALADINLKHFNAHIINTRGKTPLDAVKEMNDVMGK